jgi:hypothetical protein
MKTRGNYSGTRGDSGQGDENIPVYNEDKGEIFRYQRGQWRGGREYSGTIDRVGKYFRTVADSGEG